jgi:hypothetical protein
MNFSFKKIVTSTLLLLAVYAVYAVVVMSWEHYQSQKQEVDDKPLATVNSALLSSNKDYAIADSLLKGRRGKEAADVFTRVFATAESNTEKSQIEMKIGESHVMAGDYAKAISVFKSIVANEAYQPRPKAFAVNAMGQLLYSFVTPEVTKLIFESGDQPYIEMYKERDPFLAYRRLFEYSTSFEPIAPAELRVVRWYTRALLENDEDFSQESRAVVMREVQERLARANESIQEMRRDPNMSAPLAQALLNKAAVLVDLKELGEPVSEDIEAIFTDAQKYSVISANSESALRYSYALYLARTHGSARKADVIKAFRVLYATPAYANTPILRVFKEEKNNIIGSKKDILLLASIDPEFKQYLITQGWTF